MATIKRTSCAPFPTSPPVPILLAGGPHSATGASVRSDIACLVRQVCKCKQVSVSLSYAIEG